MCVSKKLSNCHDPVFEQDLVLRVHQPPDAALAPELLLMVWDEDFFGAREFLGECRSRPGGLVHPHTLTQPPPAPRRCQPNLPKPIPPRRAHGLRVELVGRKSGGVVWQDLRDHRGRPIVPKRFQQAGRERVSR